ncbi:MAG: calcium-binding protein [Pseudomonadota bacterium]
MPKCLGSTYDDGDDYVDGGAGNDRMDGGSGDDQIYGRSGDDTLTGGEGDDLLVPGTGYDIVEGGAGIDTVNYTQDGSQAGWTVTLEQAIDAEGVRRGMAFLTGGAEADLLYDIENVSGSAGDDVIIGSGLDNVLRGYGGNDHIVGGDGNDTIAGGNGVDTLEGGSGRDTVDFRNDSAAVTVILIWGVSSSAGNPGETLVSFEHAIGSHYDDTMYGDNGSNRLEGGFGDDYIVGLDGNDYLYGGRDNDTLDGGEGRDRLTGDEGDDTLIGDVKNSERLNGGSGRDTADYSADTNGVSVLLDNIDTPGSVDGEVKGVWFPNGPDEPGKVWIDTLTDIENVTGGTGDDFIFGTTHRAGNVLRGGGGDDEIIGAGGNDTIFGEDGNDTIHVGFGDTEIDGGDGLDHLFYTDLERGLAIDLAVGSATFRDDLGDRKQDVIRDIEEVTGTRGDDFIVGSSGADTLNGGEGDDTIVGGDGDDVIAGGAGLDRIIYNESDGDDLVYFNAEEDVLDLTSWGYVSLSELSNDLSQLMSGGMTSVIFYGDPAGDILTLSNTSLSQLDATNILI